ncbi:hypothetical protein YPPY94_3287, partial [Yersinia pestis PY-94]
MPYIGWLWGV